MNAVLLLFASLASSSATQAEPRQPDPRPLAAEIRLLRRQLADAGRPSIEREATLQKFLAEHGDKEGLSDADRRLLRPLRARLAILALANRKPGLATQLFLELDRDCTAEELDLKARCRLGIAQAYELRGRSREAVRRYDDVMRTFAGTRYARLARLARDRLQGRKKLALDLPLVLPHGLRTVDGRTLPEKRRQWMLLAFLAPDADRLPEAVRGSLQDRLSLEVLLSVPGPRAAMWAERLGRRAWVVRGSLHRRLGVGVLPTWVLVDRSNLVVDWNPTVERVQKWLQR